MYMYTFPPHPAASAWLLNELHLYLPLYSEIVYGDIHYFGLQQKKKKSLLHKRKEEKCWFCEKKKKKNRQVYSGRSGLLLQSSKMA